jgi:hypothetical protein
MDKPDRPGRGPLTDSGWFWGLVFSLAAIFAIGLIAPRFAIRQRQVEGRFLGRQTMADERSRRAAGLAARDLAEQARDRDEVQQGRIVPLWTLAGGAAVAAVGCGMMLWRERSRPAVSR